jgi:hypothetical protein
MWFVLLIPLGQSGFRRSVDILQGVAVDLEN